MQTVKIGTRGSKLALWQAYHVADLLEKNGIASEIIIIETKGDKILDVSIAKIGSKGVFTEELEDQLASGVIDIAVHSAKDMQSSLPDGFDLIAFTEREKVNDIILSHLEDIDYTDTSKPLILGTSSTRRVATLKHFYPHIKTVEVRGNLQTRISKMESGVCDALLLAYAGAHRMGYDSMIRAELSLDEFTPAVGQGSVAIEAASTLDKALKAKIVEATHHKTTGYRLLAERAYLRVLEGGCSIPVFALADCKEEMLTIKGGIVSLDGSERIIHEVTGNVKDAELLGFKLADKVLQSGGDRILKSIKNALNK
ncbi:hydroxymethylbilane synthase [Belliella kenyensis]|uniref:Hydroxymethylbilane synthase n=1 Tax=Belliella kenyensis TaxID=1472724 RepID=A0ABV8EID3_9BACT|nr:hydroxymethylbilane synthase [Belliella kenyensis]MCH7401018.1 hydroxymethylbilane synthase [Belliella kenyensis]MDN3604016.1 hydroxymethylbilane synthase [Belliella kenyensis]